MAMANAASAPKDEAMAAVIGPGACDISPSGSDVWLANLNEPAQAVISGTSAAVAAESSHAQPPAGGCGVGLHSSIVQLPRLPADGAGNRVGAGSSAGGLPFCGLFFCLPTAVR